MQKQELNALTLKTSEDPDEFGTNISRLEIEYKHKLSQEDKIAALVGAAGPKYANTIFNSYEPSGAYMHRLYIGLA